MNKLISIIVPVYKVEHYLKRCVESILTQSYKNLEIILVDDGSPDKCGWLCDQFAEKDSRIKVIHKRNGGLSDARNAGLDIAQGEYISFIDSDDYVHQEYINRLYQLICEKAADISSCGFIKTSKEDIMMNINDNKIYEYTNIEALEKLAGKFHVQMVVAWGKLYYKDLFKEIRFPVGKIHEDEFIAHKLLYKAKKIVLTTEPLLYYWQRKDSIMGKGFNIRHQLHIVQAFHERAGFYHEVGLTELSNKTYKTVFFYYMPIIEHKSALHEIDNKNDILNDYKSLKGKLREGKYNFKFKILYELYYKMPIFMKQIFNFYGKYQMRGKKLSKVERIQ